MDDITESQTDLLQVFCEVTTCDVSTGRTILESSGWDLESAISLYYEQQNMNMNVGTSTNANTYMGEENGTFSTEEQANASSTTECQTENNTGPGNVKESMNFLKTNRYFRVFLSICGTTLSAIFGFFKTLFCVPNPTGRAQDHTSVRSLNRTVISQIEQAQIEEARRIREEQDLEYMRSLNLDSMKQERGLKKKRSKDLVKERRERHLAELQPEREIEKENCSRVCVKNSAGKKFQRNFHKEDSVYEIFKWIDSLGIDESNLISDKFSLRLPHSKSVEIDESYIDNKTTISEIGFYPNTLLLVNNFDEDSDN